MVGSWCHTRTLSPRGGSPGSPGGRSARDDLQKLSRKEFKDEVSKLGVVLGAKPASRKALGRAAPTSATPGVLGGMLPSLCSLYVRPSCVDKLKRRGRAVQSATMNQYTCRHAIR